MTYDELKAQLDEEYDRAAAETLSRLKKIKPLTKQKLAKALFEANKAYWAARLALIDADMVYEAERTAAALAVPYANAMETFAGRVRNIYAGYQSAFDLSKKEAKELLEKVRYDRTIAENLRTIAEGMPDGEDKTRILAEISAPAYRYRLQRAEKMSEQAKEVCDAIARGEIRTDRALFQTQTEKAYNITLDEITNGREPAGAVLDAITPEPEQLRILEMPRGGAPIEDFSPTTDRGVLDSFSLINSKAVKEITERDWSGSSFSDSVWSNTGELAKEVKQVLLEGELTGASEADMAAKIEERFQVGMYKARRVVRTESNYCVNQAELKGMKDAGFDEYEFMSLHEERDCEACDDLDGEVFRIADAVVGVNMPPIHPFCRCKITTKAETAEDIQADIDRLLDGRSIEDIERELDRLIAEREAEQMLSAAMSGESENEDNSLNMLTTDNGGDIIDTYKGKGISVFPEAEIPQEVISRVENATKMITSDFKALEKMSEGITFGEVEDNALGINRYDPSTGKDTITMLKSGFANPDALLQQLRDDYKSSVSYDTDYIESIAAHEMGHNAHIALALKRAGLEYGKPLSIIEQELFKTEFTKIQQEIYEAAFTDESFYELQNICVEQLGLMTYCNADELIAQSFGNYYYGSVKSSVGEKIVKYFKKGLK